MAHGEVKRFPGYGVIYIEGGAGLKVIHTYVEGPHRIFNPDGTVSYTTPPPLIHELYPALKLDKDGNIIECGGFTYASGEPVSDRKHLECILDIAFKERALYWFNSLGKISEKAMAEGKPEKTPDKPETIFVTSNDLPRAEDKLTKGLVKQIAKADEGVAFQYKMSSEISEVMKALDGITKILETQNKRLTDLENMGNLKTRETIRRQSESMKAKWKDPEYRKGILEKMAKSRTKGGKDGNDTTQASSEV